MGGIDRLNYRWVRNKAGDQHRPPTNILECNALTAGKDRNPPLVTPGLYGGGFFS